MPADATSDATVIARGITKRFGATTALDRVDLQLRPGIIHALLGGNGSGKSTFVKVLAGVHHADEGSLERFGHVHALHHFNPAAAHRIGLRFVHQSLGLFSDLSVAENLALGTGYPTRAGGIRWRVVRADARRLIDHFGIASKPDTLVRDLRPAVQAIVAIARALADDATSADAAAHVLVVDEATAALPQEETAHFLHALRGLAASGRAVLFISHRVQEVLDVADEITVLRDGRVVDRRDALDLRRHELVELLSGGRAVDVAPVRSVGRVTRPRLSVRGLDAGPLRAVDVTAHAGEIVGISGLLGSGRSTVLETAFGARPRRSGVVEVDGLPLAGGPAAAMRAGVALVPESRARQAIFGSRSVADNLTEAVALRYWRRGWLSQRRVHSCARSMITRHSIVAAHEQKSVSTLSGGNQQKVVLARWLERRPTVLLLDEPTQGVDIVARAAIHNMIREATAQGACALLVSSDVDELVEMSSRIIVLADGRVAGERVAPFDRAELLALEQIASEESVVISTEREESIS
jgi:ribose transport system ATP-binding protein